MNVIALQQDDPAYPNSLRKHLKEEAPERIFLLGNMGLLENESLGFFCSIKCPGNIILKTCDLAKALRDAGVPVISGFHTPMEKECLEILLRGTQPIRICPARSLKKMRPTTAVKEGIEAGRVLLVSPFGAKHRRATAKLADQRNHLVAALSRRIFVPYAAPGGKTEALCREMIAIGKPLFTVDSQENANLLALGAKALAVGDVSGLR